MKKVKYKFYFIGCAKVVIITVIIAIKANRGLEGIVVAADNQLTILKTLAEEEYEIPETKRMINKLIKGRNWVIGYAGGSSEDQIDRFSKLFNGESKKHKAKKAILTAISNYDKRQRINLSDEGFEKIIPDFYETNLLNTHLMRDKNSSVSDTYEFILAINYPKLRLFHVDEFGNLDEVKKSFPYLCIGSGKKEADKYIEDYIDSLEDETPLLSISESIKLVKGALEKSAGRDPYTGGNGDIVVLTKNKIKCFGNDIKEAYKKAADKLFKKIISYYKE